jgi:peptide subunit release factor 1 (eRF1)
MLLVNEDFSASGLRCRSCGSLSPVDPCPFCGAATELLEDIVESIVSQAFIQNCDIRFITGANKARLGELGNIGALLRFAG